MLNKIIKQRIVDARAQLTDEDALLPLDKLQAAYARFRDKFGPDKLKNLDGEELLNTLHLQGSKNALVYWLEFKDDDEFPANFGSIAGGSSLKYRIYNRKETGAWMKGNNINQEEITLQAAIEIAREHKNELIAASDALDSLRNDADERDYAALQTTLTAIAPHINDSSWGHKYLSLIAPTKLDDYHVVEYQRFHLIKCLQIPPDSEGRYICAGRYVEMARELGMPLNHLTSTLNRINGRPYKVWRIGTKIDGVSIWTSMRENKRVSIGWDMLGDLSWVRKNEEDKSRLRATLHETGYSSDAKTITRKAGEIFNFVAKIEDGDLVLAADGERILAIGRVTGPYFHDGEAGQVAPNCRPVEWLDEGGWRLPTQTEGLQTTVFQIKKYPDNLVAIEDRLLSPNAPKVSSLEDQPAPSFPTPIRLEKIAGRLQAILERKGQAILYGPPGTGKTFWAKNAVLDMASLKAFKKTFTQLTSQEKKVVEGDDSAEGLVRFCTFHPNYGYEDFLEGYRPQPGDAGGLAFDLKDGIFKKLCRDAKASQAHEFYLIIDEINRGDIPRIFGELITLIEWDKRNQSLRLPLSSHPFSVPKNVFIVGTMNTADRSIALLDTALRRRFGFVELLPDAKALQGVLIADKLPLQSFLLALNEKILENAGREARNLQIGHAYLLRDGKPLSDITEFVSVLAQDIIPLLEEYCYGDYGALAKILGASLIDEKTQRVREELFSLDRSGDLIDAIWRHFEGFVKFGETIKEAEAAAAMEKNSDKDEE